MTDALIDHAVAIAADLQIRGAEAVYAAAAVERAMPVVAWDNELWNRAAAIVTTIHP